MSQDGTTEFYIVRDNSKRVSEQQSTGTLPNFLEAHLYQSFNVEIFTRVRTKVGPHYLLTLNAKRVAYLAYIYILLYQSFNVKRY